MLGVNRELMARKYTKKVYMDASHSPAPKDVR